MSEELTPGTSTWHDTITSPTTGDAVDQNAWKLGNQDLADNLGYLKALTLPNRIVSDQSVGVGDGTTFGNYQEVTGDTDWHDVTDGSAPMSLVFTGLESGDRVRIMCRLFAEASGVAAFRANVVFDGTDHIVEGSGARPPEPAAGWGTVMCVGTYEMPSDEASATVKIQAKVSDGGDTLTIYNGINLDVQVIRP